MQSNSSSCNWPLENEDSIEVSQPAGGSYPYFIDISAHTSLAWTPNLPMPASSLAHPSWGNGTGFVYGNSAAGQTGQNEPAWPTTAGETVVDGSLTWTADVPPASGQDAIASVVWSQVSPPDSALTLTHTTNNQFRANVNLVGGTIGNVYTVQVIITMTSGAEYVGCIIVTILPP